MIQTNYRWEKPINGVAQWMVWLLVAALLLVLVWASIAKVRVYALVRGTLAPRTQPVQVGAPSAGRVVETRVQQWQKVKKGDVLYVLDGMARDPQDAKLQLRMSRNNNEQAQATIAMAEADYKAKKLELEGARQIYAVGGLPKAQYDAAVLAAQAAEAKLRQAQAQGGTAETQLEVLGRNQRIPVVSPINGQIMQLGDIHNGQMLGTGQGGVQILPEGVPLVFKGRAAEQDRPKLQDGARVQIAWNGYPRQKYGVTVGTLTGVSPTSTTPNPANLAGAASARDLTSPQYEIEVTLPGGAAPRLGEKPLLPGMAGEAHVQAKQKTVLGLFIDWIRGADPWN